MDIRPDACNVYYNIVGHISIVMPGTTEESARDLAKAVAKKLAEAAAERLFKEVNVQCPPAVDPECTKPKKMAAPGTASEKSTNQVADHLYLSEASCSYELAYGCFGPTPGKGAKGPVYKLA